MVMQKKTPKKTFFAIKDFENATEALTEVFMDTYFPNTYKKETFWVCDEIGSVFFINDYFFTLDRILESLRRNVSRKQLFGYYDYELEHSTTHPNEPTPINFSHYLKQNETREM